MKALLGFCLFLASCIAQDADSDSSVYTPPTCPSCLLLETFEGNWQSEWIHSSNNKYNGRVQSTVREAEGITNDHGLILPMSHRHYGISKALPVPIDNDKKSFVVQYELSLKEKIDCGGAYLKLLSSKAGELTTLADNTPYTIMFGPDRCGSTNKIHVIFRHVNKKTGEVEEKHLLDSPTFPNDRLSHVYTFGVFSDNTYNLLVDGVSKKSGNLFTDFDPPFQPPKEIDDPNDSKPDDWVNDFRIPDPTATKPDDWDEDAPMMVPDLEATKPKGWLDHEPPLIPDMTAKKPDDWDDEEDGDFEPPLIPNPACEKVGCGEWKVPTVRNPAYKGKWTAPMVPNPAWKGEWKPQRIENPDYYEETAPAQFTPIGAVALELWITNKDLVFDNILLARDLNVALDYAKLTWGVRHEVEKVKHKDELKQSGGSNDYLELVTEFVTEHPIECAVATSVFLLISLFFCLRSSSSSEDVVSAHKKHDDAARPDDDNSASDDNSDNIDNTNGNNDNDKGDTGAQPDKPQTKADEPRASKPEKAANQSEAKAKPKAKETQKPKKRD